MKPSSRKQKGSGFERELAKAFAQLGWLDAHRQPLSGALDRFPGDVIARPPWYYRALQFECKRYKNGWPKADKQLESCYILRMSRPIGECWYLRLSTFFSALGAAEKSMAGNLVGLLTDSRPSLARLSMADHYLESGNDAFVIRADHSDTRVYMTKGILLDLLDAAGAVREAA